MSRSNRRFIIHPTRPKAMNGRGWVGCIFCLYTLDYMHTSWHIVLKLNAKNGSTNSQLVSIAHTSSWKILFMENQVITGYCWGYHTFNKKPGYYMVQLWVLVFKQGFLQYVKCYHVFFLQVICQKRNPQIHDLFLSVMHILGPENIVLGDPGYSRLLLLEVTMYSTRTYVTTWYNWEWLLYV